ASYSATSTFFFSSRRRHTRSKRDWSSDVCSSDLREAVRQMRAALVHGLAHLPDGFAVGLPPPHADRPVPAEKLPEPREVDRLDRSEERRVGKECRARWSDSHQENLHSADGGKIGG